nr:protein-tyrosine-phosphatase [Saprospiraceae bacterium]
MTTNLSQFISDLSLQSIAEERKKVLDHLIEECRAHLQKHQPLHLNFICTHNSRRSQMAQIWAWVSSVHYGLPSIRCFSGGTEVTQFNLRAVQSLQNCGLLIDTASERENPQYEVRMEKGGQALLCFSKHFDHRMIPKPYIAIMVCSHAEQNCPFIPDALARYALPFEDPGQSDGTGKEEETYRASCREIAREMLYFVKGLLSK